MNAIATASTPSAANASAAAATSSSHQRRVLGAVGPDPPLTGSRRWRGTSGARRAPEQVVRILAVAAAQLEHVAEAAGDQQADASRPGARSSAFRPTVVPCTNVSRAGQRVRR